MQADSKGHEPTLQAQTCWDCRKSLQKGDPVMHITMDQFAEWKGLAPLGMDDFMKFTICEGCTVEGSSPFALEPLV